MQYVSSQLVTETTFGADKWSEFSSDPKYKSVRAVRMGYLPEYLGAEGKFSMTLPENRVLHFQTVQSGTSELGYIWSGQDQFDHGFGVFGSDGTYDVATFFYDDAVFHVYPVSAEY